MGNSISSNLTDYATPSKNPVLFYCLGFSLVVGLADSYLDYRQRQIYKKKDHKLPEVFKDVMSEEKFEKSRLYALDRSYFSLYSGSFSSIKDLGFTLLFVTPLMLKFCSDLTEGFLPSWNREFVVTNTFLIVSGLLDTLISLPFKLYSQFVIEENHGFNKMSYKFYFMDLLKQLAVSTVIQLPITWILIYCINKTGDYFVPITWSVTCGITLLMMTIYPAFIAPLFDKYTPLEDSELKTKIEALAKQIDFPLTKLFVVDGSNRSSHSNAYMYGFHKNKRIVLYDTLIHKFKLKNGEENEKGCNDDEICSVLGHELGHWKMGHVMKNLVITQAILFMYFYGFSKVQNNAELFSQFGFSPDEAPPSLIQLSYATGFLMAPINEVIGCFMVMFSRYNEYQADEYAYKLNSKYGPLLKSSLKKLQTDNLSFPIHDKWYSWRHHSHPSTIERCETIDEMMKKE